MKLKKIARVIPFGYKDSEEQGYLDSIPEEIQALDEAKNYLNTCSYREVAEWLHRKTGRYISHVGLRKRIKNDRTSEAKEETESQGTEISQGDIKSV
jgi:hypothetical protein